MERLDLVEKTIAPYIGWKRKRYCARPEPIYLDVRWHAQLFRALETAWSRANKPASEAHRHWMAGHAACNVLLLQRSLFAVPTLRRVVSRLTLREWRALWLTCRASHNALRVFSATAVEKRTRAVSHDCWRAHYCWFPPWKHVCMARLYSPIPFQDAYANYLDKQFTRLLRLHRRHGECHVETLRRVCRELVPPAV